MLKSANDFLSLLIINHLISVIIMLIYQVVRRSDSWHTLKNSVPETDRPTRNFLSKHKPTNQTVFKSHNFDARNLCKFLALASGTRYQIPERLSPY